MTEEPNATAETRAPSRPVTPEPPTPAKTVGSGPKQKSGASILSQLRRRGRAGAVDYAYQILIVIIGVFLGISFESMASERERTLKAHAALDRLVEDLRRDDADMSRIIEQQRGQSRDFTEIATWLATTSETRSERIDSLLAKVVTSLTVYPRRGIYTSMITSGQIGLLPEDVAASVVNLYENIYTRLAANGEHYDYSLERDFLPSYANAWDPAVQALITSDPAERARFRNHLLLMREWSSYYSDLVVQGQEEVRKVLADIDRVRSDD